MSDVVAEATVVDRVTITGNSPSNKMTIERVMCKNDPTVPKDGIYYRFLIDVWHTEHFGLTEAGAHRISEFLAGGLGEFVNE